jgi:bifunctional DNA-binding transcriptional regulator/antitoxin component of YhaV-PrlF toxin-antitoxin module
MSGPLIRKLNANSEGQVTLSDTAREKLGIDKGASVIEVVTNGCVILVPDDPILSEAMKTAREALARSGVTPDEINAEIERLKAERFARDFPDLAS